jgi:hypothetical protein
LVLGPWLGGSLPPTIAGLVLHISATVVLVVSLVRSLKQNGKLTTAGGWHVVSSYIWILLPVLMAPTILLGIFEAGPIESTAPQALIYGWVLQFGIAVIPYLARKYFLKEETPELGGCWGSLALANLGSVLIWVSIFSGTAKGIIYGIGFVLYALALIHPLKELTEITRTGLKKFEAA